MNRLVVPLCALLSACVSLPGPMTDPVDRAYTWTFYRTEGTCSAVHSYIGSAADLCDFVTLHESYEVWCREHGFKLKLFPSLEPDGAQRGTLIRAELGSGCSGVYDAVGVEL